DLASIARDHLQHVAPSGVELGVIKQIDKSESPAGFERPQRLGDTYGLIRHVAHLVEGQTTDHPSEPCVGEWEPGGASMDEQETLYTFKRRVALGLCARVLPVIAPVVEPDVVARGRLHEADEQLSAPASHIQQPPFGPHRVDEELMNSALYVA